MCLCWAGSLSALFQLTTHWPSLPFLTHSFTQSCTATMASVLWALQCGHIFGGNGTSPSYKLASLSSTTSLQWFLRVDKKDIHHNCSPLPTVNQFFFWFFFIDSIRKLMVVVLIEWKANDKLYFCCFIVKIKLKKFITIVCLLLWAKIIFTHQTVVTFNWKCYSKTCKNFPFAKPTILFYRHATKQQQEIVPTNQEVELFVMLKLRFTFRIRNLKKF